jgi:hypothetical protein
VLLCRLPAHHHNHVCALSGLASSRKGKSFINCYNCASHLSHSFALDQMTSADKDFRFMATNDLMGELQKASIKLDDESEKKIVKMLLQLLEDKNGEVQNLAVKW